MILGELGMEFLNLKDPRFAFADPDSAKMSRSRVLLEALNEGSAASRHTNPTGKSTAVQGDRECIDRQVWNFPGSTPWCGQRQRASAQGPESKHKDFRPILNCLQVLIYIVQHCAIHCATEMF